MLKQQTFDHSDARLNYVEACPERRTECPPEPVEERVEACPEQCRRVPVEGSPPGDRPLLLLHGLGSRWQTWLHLIPLLTLRWHVYAPDLPGHGLSAHTSRYRATDHADAARTFLQTRVATPAHPAVVIGHSLGGSVAALLAASAPDFVRALILVDPPIFDPAVGYTGAEFRDFFVTVRRIARERLPFDRLLAAVAETFPHRDAAGHRLYAANLRTIDPEVYTPAIERRIGEGIDWDLTLARIECPVLLIQADPAMESALSDHAATHAAAMLPDATLIRMHGIGHAVHRDAPTEFSRILTDFLESL